MIPVQNTVQAACERSLRVCGEIEAEKHPLQQSFGNDSLGKNNAYALARYLHIVPVRDAVERKAHPFVRLIAVHTGGINIHLQGGLILVLHIARINAGDARNALVRLAGAVDAGVDGFVEEIQKVRRPFQPSNNLIHGFKSVWRNTQLFPSGGPLRS